MSSINQIKQLRPYQAEALFTLRKRLRETTVPLLVNASVGAGKSLIIAELLLVIERAGWRALCLTLSSTLIQQNSDTYKLQNGQCGIYCAGLNAKEFENPVIFASPHSVCKDIRNKGNISRQPFNLIVVDEAHNINPHDNNSMYMRILNHFGMKAQTERYSYRVVGLTGTPYRGKAESIVGDNAYFKEEVCSISSKWLIDNNYLVPTVFGKTQVESFDMSRIRVDKMGKFKHKDLQDAVDRNERLTGLIMKEVIETVEAGRQGAFIFASTLNHAAECMRALPPDQSACITGDTPHDERKEILSAAKEGIIKYLVNVATLLVGVDVPNFDVCAWLRPTESLTLYTQGIGRVLRISPLKKNALVLDYAGNVDRHGDIDDPLINEALQPMEEDDPEYVIKCWECNFMNKETARRCIGVVNNKRCEHYFQFKECICGTKNDITARHCRHCKKELINPNDKLNKKSELMTLDVLEAQYWVSIQRFTIFPVINVKYKTNGAYVFESYFTNSDKAKSYFYAKFLKLHLTEPSKYWPYMASIEKMKEMLHDEILTPVKLTCKKDKWERLFITRKIFNPSDCKTSES